MITRRTALFGIAATTLIAAHGAWAQTASTPVPPLALRGYDPVAYFTDSKPVEGKAEFEITWDGQRYRFASAQHRALFKATPDKYAPQFGGSCAMNMSAGVRRESDPHNWTIVNGNLYVFAGARGLENFKQNVATNSSKAEDNWKTLKATPTQ
jgi:YHS domain-containing protein